jgi:hypothetical protein
MEKLAENDLAYFYLRHVVIVVTAVTTISLTPVVFDFVEYFCNGLVLFLSYDHLNDILSTIDDFWNLFHFLNIFIEVPDGSFICVLGISNLHVTWEITLNAKHVFGLFTWKTWKCWMRVHLNWNNHGRK